MKGGYADKGEDVYALLNQFVPEQIGSVDENSQEFQRLEDWANSYLDGIDCNHPLFKPLSDHLCTHGEIIGIARQHCVQDYLAVAEPLYVAWLKA